MRIELPWPPSTNTYWRHVGSRVLLSKDGRDYRKRVGWIALELRLAGVIPKLPMQDRVKVTILASPPDQRRRDLDNLLKSLLDALSHASVWLDDSQVDDLRVIRVAPTKPGRVEITISPLAARVAA